MALQRAARMDFRGLTSGILDMGLGVTQNAPQEIRGKTERIDNARDVPVRSGPVRSVPDRVPFWMYPVLAGPSFRPFRTICSGPFRALAEPLGPKASGSMESSIAQRS